MTVRVLVIPEDPLLDQYILRPIVERMFSDLGRRATVEVLQKPRLRGVDQALDSEKLRTVIADRRMFDLFLIMVDRDCDDDRIGRLRALEQEHPQMLVGCLAVQEVEVWMLALYRDQLGERWRAVRDECNPKERYAWPFLVGRGWNTGPGRGRVRAMDALAAEWKGLLAVCPELEDLRDRLLAWTDGAPT